MFTRQPVRNSKYQFNNRRPFPASRVSRVRTRKNEWKDRRYFSLSFFHHAYTKVLRGPNTQHSHAWNEKKSAKL